MPKRPLYVASETTKLAQPIEVGRQFSRLSRDPGVQALIADLDAKDFKPVARGPNAFFGLTKAYKSSDGKTATFGLSLQSYSKAGSGDEAAVAVITITSGKESDTYRFSLVAPKGDFRNAVERRVDARNTVRLANSWWSRCKACLKKKCIAVCLGALVTCSGTWAAYLACVAAACGGCFVACAACAACNCRWWCKWAAGCCAD